MKTIRAAFLLRTFFLVTALAVLFPTSYGRAETGGDFSWPEVTRTARPWTYWWWMGSAVEKDEITANLEALSGAGLGGVHIIPIYGAEGHEELYIDFLSPKWMSAFQHTLSEASRLDMGVDMSAGTGWPFGGPQVTPEHAAKTFSLKKRGGSYKLEVKNTGQKVKRAAPGGEGLVMDYYSREALDQYLARFDKAFASTDARPRSFYNDSFEVYGADWTDGLFDEFEKRRGYDLREHLAALDGKGDPDYRARVMCDYSETVSDLLLDEFTRPWVKWSHAMGTITRDQAHGSPGNLLDLYAAADIPETEAFGPSHFDIPGLEYYKSLPEHRGGPDLLVMKFASSAANVTGGRLVSSESCTWLGEHFTISLAHVKPEIEKLWLGGINHVFFHGTTYSPTWEEWPGWLFYAPTNFGPSNTQFRDLPALNRYIARTQSFLQEGGPDSDVLLYWPVHDLWSGVYDTPAGEVFRERLASAAKNLLKGRLGKFAGDLQSAVVGLYEARRSKVKMFSVHDAGEWLHGTPFGEIARKLMERGVSFDYVSDRMVAGLTYNSSISSRDGGRYKAILVPPVKYVPETTMEKLSALSRQGARIIFMDEYPDDVPGLADLEIRRERLRQAVAGLDSGNVDVGKDLEAMLSNAGVNQEPMVDEGLSFIRKAHDDGRCYFIVNLGPETVNGWVEVATPAQSAVLYDTLHGRSGLAAVRPSGKDMAEVYLELGPGQSIVLKTFEELTVKGREWQYLEKSGPPVDVAGTWQVEFVTGGPTLPQAYSTDALGSWTERGGDYRYFSGTARYSIEFDFSETYAKEWMLELGEVHESARVFINGEEAGVLFSFPYCMRVGEYVRPGVNFLEIEVTNLSANRIIYLDRTMTKWKKFRDINFVNVGYTPFNAALWKPFPSGLVGPVRLVPNRERMD